MHKLKLYCNHHVAQMCSILLTAPSNGSLECPDGQVTDANCTVTCEAGYDVLGSSQRTCLADGSWSGEPFSCQPQQCPIPIPPGNGYIQLPCSLDYGSSCSIRCFDGFDISDSDQEFDCYLYNMENSTSDIDGVQWTDSGTCESKCKNINIV